MKTRMEVEHDTSGGTPTTTNVDSFNLAVGTVVQVQARTWPGINKPGGVGRITHLHLSNSKVTDIDVHYIVMGGRERRVPIQYVKLAPEYAVSPMSDDAAASAPNAISRSQRSQLRDRSIMLGRCRRCGSLRTDCGSCDWMEQQRLAEQARKQSAETGDDMEGDLERDGRKKRRKIQKAVIEESLSSSSDEELLEQMQAIDRRRRRHSREKVQWRRVLGDSSCESSQRGDGSHDESLLSSSDLDDPILARLAQVTCQQRRSKASLLELKYAKPKRKRRRRRQWHSSATTLESLRDRCIASSITLRTAPIPGNFQFPSPAVSPKSHHDVNSSETVENVGDTDASPESDLRSPNSDQSKKIRTKEHNNTRFGSQGGYEPDFGLDLDGLGFIQPEGEVAAEHLPQDIIDRTLSVPFKQLPSFFDKLAMELQDDIFPDVKLALSDFKQKSREAQNCNGTSVLPRSKEERHILYSRIQRKVIMDGVDQCRAAMRRMVNQKLRRRHKTSMTADEQKHFRRTTLELRDIKLDELERMADETLKKAGDLLLDTGVMNDDSDIGDCEASASDGAGSETSASTVTQVLVDVGTYRSDAQFEGDDATPLAPFDPHMHATTIKCTKSLKQGKRRHSAGNQSRRNRKMKSREGELSFEDTTTATRRLERGQPSQKRRRGRRRRSASYIQQSDDTSDPNSDQSLFDAELMSFEAHSSAAPSSRANARYSCGRYGGTSDGKTGDDKQSSNEKGSNRKPIADRMQAFLDANSSNIDGFSWSLDDSKDRVNNITRLRNDAHPVQSSGCPNLKPKADRSRRMKARYNQASAPSSTEAADSDNHDNPFLDPDSSPDDENDDATNAPMNLSTEMMYRRLAVRKEETPPSSRIRLTAPLLDSCRALLAAYPESAEDSISLFKGVVNHFKAETPIIHSEAVEVFRTVLLLLQRHDNMTLQAIALTDSKHLQLHIQLLIFTVNLLESEVGSALVPQDGNIYCLFGHRMSNIFVEIVVLQMVDVIYAQAQSCCWALGSFRINGLMGLLGPLRDALARLVPLVETISYCITQKFQCQKWRDYVGHSESFVSAVDPEEYKSCLLDGKMTTSSSSAGSVRFCCFKAAIPRREIETIWTLFAFFADASAVDCDAVRGDRWRLIASLFFSHAGVLSKDALEPVGSDAVTPPSKEHMKSCLLEIGYFRTLITTTTLNPLPSSDGILIKLVQKCLHLLALDYTYSFESVNPNPMRGLDEMDRARLSRIWNVIHLLLKHDSKTSIHTNSSTIIAVRDDFEEHMSDMRVTGFMTGALSTSALSGVSVLVSLIWAWVRQVPKKKARLSRLAESLNKLVSDCIDKASDLEQGNVDGAGGVYTYSTFQEAFTPTLFNNGYSRAATAYREAAARLSLTCAYTRTAERTLTEDLRNKVWESLADFEMKERQRCIVARIAMNGNPYGGDLFRLFSTAKTLAWLTGLHFGADDTTPETTPRTPIWGPDDDRRSFVFLTSCLIACLDCACDQVERQGTHFSYRCQEAVAQVEFFSSLASCVCLWLSQTCFRCQHFLKVSPSTHNTRLLNLKDAAQELRTCVFGILVSPLKRCLVCLTNATVHNKNGDTALRSVLGLIRAAVGLVSVCLEDGRVEPVAVETATEAAVPREEPTEEDFFGSIDDALFLDIDVGTLQDSYRANLSVDPDIHAFREIWSLLIGIIKLTKPSDRYAVLPPTISMSSRSACTTVQGRAQAASCVGAFCCCLAVLTSLQKQDFDVVDSSLDLLTVPLRRRGWNDLDDPDQSYFRQVVQCFYSEVCCLSADYEQCDRLVRKRRDDIIEHFIEGMLDSNTLDRFPSINLKRIKANGGPRSERKESLRLTLANRPVQSDDWVLNSINDAGARLKKGEASDFPGPAYNSLHLWSFSKNLRTVFLRTIDCPSVDGASGQDAVFMELDSDLSSRPPDMIPLVSLEKECLKRMELLRGMLSYNALVSRSEGALCFEKLSRLIFSSCSYQLVQISEGVRYHARANRDDGTMSYRHARLLELQSCYTELTVALLTWVLREVPRPIPDPFARTLRHAKENLLSKVLLKQDCDVNSVLRQLYTVATTQLGQKDIRVGSLVTTETDKPDHKFLNDMFFAALRRSRQIVLHLASEQQAGHNVYFLLDSLLAVGRDSSESTPLDRGQGDYAAEVIARAMECDVEKATAALYLQTDRSIFQQALDEYVRHVECSRDLGSQEVRSIQQLRHVAVRQFLVPMLFKHHVSLAKKRAILCLLSHLLQHEASGMAFRQDLLEIHAIVDLAKGLASCLRSALECHTIDDALICKAFQCARYVLNLPSPLNTDTPCQNQEDTVLSWSCRCNDDSDETSPTFSLYVWTFAKWMNCVGKMLIGQTGEDKKRLVQFRAKSASLTSQGRSVWSADIYPFHDMLVASSRLMDLEGKVFAEKENGRLVTNVYAKPKLKVTQSSASSTEADEWHPSSSVRRAAKEFMAEVIAVM